jgi:flagellar basal-body rod modification protein FlgD
MTTIPSSSPIGTIGVTETAKAATTDGLNTLGQDAFLKLLVAQMKYQDPSNPTDPTQFLTQTAQFTVVEKLAALSELNQKVLDASTAQSAASMLGKNVTWKDLSGGSHTGVVTATTFGSQTPTLTVDGKNVSLDDVTGIAT